MNLFSRRRVWSALALACAGAIGPVARAADTWDNSSGDAKWFTPTNWADDTVPTTNDAVTFPASAPGGATTIDLTSPAIVDSGSLTFAGSYTLANNTLRIPGGVNVTGGAVARMSGALLVTWANGMGKTGAGTLVLTTASATPHYLSVGAGTVRLEAPGIISSGSVSGTLELGGITLDKNLTMFSGSTLSATGTSAMKGVLTANNAKVTINSTGTLRLGYTDDQLVGSGNYIAITGAGSVVLAQPNSITTRWALNGGTLQISADHQLGSASSDLMFGGGTLRINGTMWFARAIYFNPEGGAIDVPSGNSVTFAGTIGGGPSGTFTKTGGGDLVIGEPAKTYSGPTIISGGILRISQDSQLGDGSSTNKLIMDGGALSLSGPLVSTRDVTLASGKESVIFTGAGVHGFGKLAGPGSLSFAGSSGKLIATHVRANALSVQNGTLAIAPDGGATGTSVLNTINITPGAKFDLSNNHLIVHATPVGTWSGTGVTGMIHSGRGNGTWNSGGIVTTQTLATTSSLTSIGVATAGQVKGIAGTATALWSGQTVSASDTLAMYTYGGDATLDGKINVDDYTRVDFNAELGVAGWFNGDFNYDGKINVDDYTIIDFNVGLQGAPFSTSAAGGFAEVTAVPEPGGMALIWIGAMALAKRRRRRRD